MKQAFKEIPIYLHCLAIIGFLIGVVAAGSSPNVETSFGAFFVGIIFSLVIYFAPAVLIIPDLLDIVFGYKKRKKDHQEFDAYVKENAKFILHKSAIDKTGRVKCPGCNFRSVVNYNYLLCAKCNEPIVVKNET